jgi:hypothetical protein
MDWTGKVKHSTMISKLCNYAPRSDFIVRVIQDLFVEYPQKQMIVLGHNRCLLVYLHDVLKQMTNGPTVGYYLGGMKQAKLDESETKQVVLATFAMAAEALDIKSLSTLLLVTPKTDIIQSVGRILRTKHANPLIVDFIDPHGCFKNQWNKRRLYYKKCNYRILKMTSIDYLMPERPEWSVLWNGAVDADSDNDDTSEHFDISSISFEKEDFDVPV